MEQRMVVMEIKFMIAKSIMALHGPKLIIRTNEDKMVQVQE